MGLFKGGGEKHRRYVGFRYVIRVFLVVFFGTLTYLRLQLYLLTYLLITYLKDKVRYKVRVRVFFKAITYLNNVGSIT